MKVVSTAFVKLSGLLGIGLMLGLLPSQAQFMGKARDTAYTEQAHQIGLALLAYATDNGFTYPEGKSSTEVFQKLIDAGYINDPNVFYIDLPGKTKFVGRQRLKPENVCFDFTAGADAGAPDALPLVFLTGYKVDYASGTAVPLAKPFPPGIAFVTKGNSARFMRPATADGAIANFTSVGKTFTQLTPSGPLP